MAATTQKTPLLMTADEFLASPLRFGVGKHQLIDGVVVAMALASPTHGLIQANLAHALKAHFKATGQPCVVMTEAGVKPRVRGRANVRAPDLTVMCGAAPQAGDGLVRDPVLIIEVLSPSNDDQTESAILSCASIPSVREMLVIDSSRVFAEVWRRDAGGAWPAEPEALADGGAVRLDCVGLSLSLGDIYADTYLSNS